MAPAADPATGRALHEAARWLQAGELSKAGAACRRILERQSDQPDALHLLGIARLRQGQAGAAEDLLHRAVAARPNFPEAVNNLGNILKDKGELDEAARCYRQTLQMNPRHAMAHFNLANVLRDQGRTEEAIENYRRALTLDPNYAAAHNNLGRTLQDLGRNEEAIACYQRVLAINPEHASAHINLGNTLKAEGKLEDAVTVYRAALDLEPNRAETLNLLGIAHRKLGRTEEALKTFGRALTIKPDFPEAFNNVSIALHELNRYEEAIAYAERALQADPGRWYAHINLGNALMGLSKLDEAVACFRRALEIKPDHPITHNNLGYAMNARGCFEEAAAEFERALALEPDMVEPHRNLAFIKKIKPNDTLIARIKGLLRNGKLSDNERSNLNFSLGKCFNDIGEYDRAFAHYQAGNDIKKQGQPFDAGGFAAETDRIIATFTRAFFEDGESLGGDTERPVFIIGMPRSGTTLVEQILASHPEVFGAGELRDVQIWAQELQAYLGCAEPYPECTTQLDRDSARDLAQGYIDHLVEFAPNVLRVCDKMPQNFRHLGLIALLLPRARIIHCRREALDVCLSCYFQDFSRQPFSYDLGQIGSYYREYERLMAHWTETLAQPILEVQYEHLVADTEMVSRKMIEFCGLEWDNACLAFHKTDRAVLTASQWQVRQPVYKSSVQRWKRYEKHLGVLLRELNGTD